MWISTLPSYEVFNWLYGIVLYSLSHGLVQSHYGISKFLTLINIYLFVIYNQHCNAQHLRKYFSLRIVSYLNCLIIHLWHENTIFEIYPNIDIHNAYKGIFRQVISMSWITYVSIYKYFYLVNSFTYHQYSCNVCQIMVGRWIRKKGYTWKHMIFNNSVIRS